MALDFGVLQAAQPVTAFFKGQQDVAQNALAQQKMAQEQETNALRRQESMLGMENTRVQLAAREEDRQRRARGEKTAAFRERLLRAPTPEAAREVVRMQYADPDLAPVLSQASTLEQALAEVPDDPAQFNQYRQIEAVGMSEYMKSQLPKVVGNAMFLPSENRFLTPPQREPAPPPMVAEYQFAQTPQGGGFRGSYHDFVVAREAAKRPPAQPVQPVAPTITTIEDPTKPGSFLQVDARTYRGGGAGSPGVIGGARPSATAEKTAAQRTQLGKDLGFAISELSNITKDGGLIDQSTGSGAGRLVDIGAGFVGQATKGAIAIGKIAPVADLALKMVPRFEGPQSDKDTASYKEAAGQLADSTLPTQIRKEAGKTVLRLMRERKNQFVTRDMAAEGAASSPAPAAVPASGALTPAEQAELQQLRSRFGGNR
jgi:hypothetical protein